MQKGQVISQGNMHIVIDYGRLPTSFGIEMKHMVFQEAYKPSVSAQVAKETEKARARKKKGAGYTVAKFHHHTSSYQQAVTDIQVKTLTLEM